MFMLKACIISVWLCLNLVESAPTDDKLLSLIRKIVKLEEEGSIKRKLPEDRVGFDERTSGAVAEDLTQADRNSILNLHNNARDAVDPPAATSLTHMTWDITLAATAETYGLRCIWGHNNNRSEGYTDYIGENLALLSARSKTAAITDGITGWVNERDYYFYNSNTCQTGKKCGHYTQVVWNTSVEIGCALITCPTVTNAPPAFNNGKFLICNYKPGGNVNGGKPYVKASNTKREEEEEFNGILIL